MHPLSIACAAFAVWLGFRFQFRSPLRGKENLPSYDVRRGIDLWIDSQWNGSLFDLHNHFDPFLLPLVKEAPLGHSLDTFEFAYYNDRAFAYGAHPQVEPKPAYSIARGMRSSYFVEQIRSGRLVYASTSSDGLPHAFAKAFAKLRAQLVDALGAEKDTHISCNLWMGAKGTRAAYHYDTSRNAFLQLGGSKRFYLAEFDVFDAGDFFPSLHPRYRQPKDYPLKSRVQEVVLHPGDVLLLPPYVLHSVESVAPSVSYNCWADSEAYIASETIFKTALPFEDSWPSSKKKRAAIAFSNHIVQGVFWINGSSANEWIRQNVAAKFRGVVDTPKDASVCGEQVVSNLACIIATRAAAVARMFRDSISDSSIRATYLSIYIESVALWAVEYDVERVSAFAESCFE